jgi:hypothetical protein
METGPVLDRNIAVRRGGELGYIAGGVTFRIDSPKFGSYAIEPGTISANVCEG